MKTIKELQEEMIARMNNAIENDLIEVKSTIVENNENLKYVGRVCFEFDGLEFYFSVAPSFVCDLSEIPVFKNINPSEKALKKLLDIVNSDKKQYIEDKIEELQKELEKLK